IGEGHLFHQGSSVKGVGVFCQIRKPFSEFPLRKLRPDYFDLLERSYLPVDEVLSVLYIEHLNEAVDFYFPFKGRAKISPGSENGW
ncbi:hypothetical protein, partial [Pseudomonas syringae group genomosp. 3]|uniref:hypothetical protein n=3 Tax=Pseudomonas syringae group genomosp. 3 TaxID=251701 RepID=UPI000AE36706